MYIDPDALHAFKTIERSFISRIGNPPPSLENLKYQLWQERQFLLRIGMALTTMPDTTHRCWIAHLIQHCFWRELGFSECPQLPAEPPLELRPTELQLPPIDVASLSKQLGALLEEEPVGSWSGALINISVLERHLHLSPAETSLLQLAYVASPNIRGSAICYEAQWSPLHTILKCLSWRDEIERNHLFSKLLAASVEDIEALFTAPISLLALHLIDNQRWNTSTHAAAHATATDNLLWLLDTPYRTNEALIADLKVLHFEYGLEPGVDLPDDELYEGLPKNMILIYSAVRDSLPLTTDQLVVLVWWQTGFELSAGSLQPLDKRFECAAIRGILLDAFLASRRAGLKPTAMTLLKALYAAA